MSKVNYMLTGGVAPYTISVKTTDGVERFISTDGSTITFNGISDNTTYIYTCKFTDSTGCTISKTISLACSNQISCDNGNTAFKVTSVNYSNNSLTYIFNAANLTTANWKITREGVSVLNGVVSPTSNTMVIALQNTIPNGDYNFVLTGTSCNGEAGNIFTVGAVNRCNVPTIVSDVISICSNQTATLTATGCTGNVKWYKNGVFTGAFGNTFSVNYNNIGEFTATCSNTNCTESNFSNNVIITQNTNCNLPSCSDNGVFEINTASYNIGVISFTYTSNNISAFTLKIYDEFDTVIHQDNIASGTNVISYSLISGNYNLELTGVDCNGVTLKRPFTVISENTDNFLFTNYLKNVPVETAVNKYSPDAFPTLSVTNTVDAKLNKLFPNWSVSWKVENGNFTDSAVNKKIQNVGISATFDVVQPFYEAYGRRCIDYVAENDPNDGSIITSDPACQGAEFNANFQNLPHTNANFISAIPFEERAGGNIGAGLDLIADWASRSNLDFFYDFGKKAVSSWFGLGDWVNGKSNVSLSDLDNEATVDPQKSLALLLAMGESTTGYTFDQYATPLDTVYLDPSKYPLDSSNPNSTYPPYTQLVDGSNGEPNSGNNGLVNNTIPNREYFNKNYKISIPSRFTGTKGLVDVPTVLPCTEVTCIVSATFNQGETYVYDNQNNTRTVNKFGVNANTQHMIAKTIFSGETLKWFIDNKLDGRKVLLQAKILCDQHTNGLLLDTNYANTYITNTALENKHFGRKHSFMIGAFTAFTGCEWNLWDRNNATVNIDGYNGAFGILNLLNQKKPFSVGGAKSFVDLKPFAKFLLWDSEISYNNGTTWNKDKGTDYALTMTKIPQRQFLTSNGYWGIFLARPENTENKSCKLRIKYNNQFYYHDVTDVMWETTDPTYKNTLLQNLPDATKHYYYTIINLNDNSTPEQVATPTISSNVNSPVIGQSVTFSSVGCNVGSTVKWYKNNTFLSNGSTITVVVANNDSYYSRCELNGVLGNNSNVISFTFNNSEIIIEEPVLPPYYFSNNHDPSYYVNNLNLPAIHKSGTTNVTDYSGKTLSGIEMQSTYNATNDIVWLKNNKIKIGINLLRGGQIAWASLIDATNNLVYNGYDGGLQIQVDVYQKEDGYNQNGKASRKAPDINSAPASYNTTMGGDFYNNSQSLIDYYQIENGYVVKFRPIFYTIDCEWSETTIEAKYTLLPDSYALKLEYTYHSFRTDTQFLGGGFDSSALPACFIVNTLNRYQLYTGNSPFTNDTITDGIIPIENEGGRFVGSPAEAIIGINTKEKWSCVYRANSTEAIGVYIPSTNDSEYTKIKQLEVYAGNPAGTEFAGGFTYFDFKGDLTSSPVNPIPDRSNFTKTLNAYLIVAPNPTTIRAEVVALENIL